MSFLFTQQLKVVRRAIVFCSFAITTFSLAANAQSSKFWTDVNSGMANAFGNRYSTPEKFRTLQLDMNSMRNYLLEAPMEFSIMAKGAEFKLSIPMPDGSFADFVIVESPVMAPGLAAKYPKIKTYVGRGITDPWAHIRLDVTHLGFHSMILSPRGDVFIDPVSNESTDFYIAYNKRDLKRNYDFVCENQDDEDLGLESKNEHSLIGYRSSGTELRKYRLALACTGEYASTKGGTISGAFSGMVTSVNRVTGVYETEVAVRMELIENDTVLIFLSSSGDPYSNTNGGAMLEQNQETIDDLIGIGNYDIGHVFSTGGGGIAWLGAVCAPGIKAQGVTGLPNPVGDAFDIDYVCHEMGHQFGANHTFNSVTGACGGGNRNAGTAYEPGSGSTIMAYAGICSPNNLQPHSDPFFHTGSFDEILDYTLEDDGGTCPVTVNTGNTPPVVVAGTDYSIPFSTPFVLSGSGSDVDGDSLSYMWEEFDKGPACDWNEPVSNAPCFRSWKADTFSYRYCPKLFAVITGTSTVGEVLPGYARSMKFRLTVRDNALSGGGVTYLDDLTTLTVINTGTPFKVTFPDAEQSNFAIGTERNINWDVSSTDTAPINCQNVNILLSIDGGFTYPVTLISNTPNDGIEFVTIPNDVNLLTDDARIMVQSADNIFYDISDQDFNITENVGIESVNNAVGNLEVFPNPTNGPLNVSINQTSKEPSTLKIYNVVGQIIEEVNMGNATGSQQYTFDLDGQAAGLYIVELASAAGSVMKKIIIQ